MDKYTPKIILAMLCFFLTSQIHANSESLERFKYELILDEEGRVNPESFIPIFWSDRWFSGIGFKDSTFLSHDKLDGFEDSKLGTSIDESVVRLNLLSYKTGNEGLSYSFGGDYQQTTIDRIEFGYFYLNNGNIDDYIAFDNTIEIEVTGFSLRGDLTLGKRTDNNRYRFNAILSPGSSLNIDQNTDFKPIVSDSGLGSSSSSPDVSYFLQLESRHRLNDSFTVGLDIQYEVLPLEYDLQVLASTADSFQNSSVDVTQTTTRIGLRLILNSFPLVKGLYPVLGITSEDIETDDNSNGGTTSQSQTLYSVGIVGQF